MKGPQTRVTLTKDFLLGATSVTQVQYETVMGTNPSFEKKAGNDAPVENVSWFEAMDFCQKLTAQERAAGRLPAGYAFHYFNLAETLKNLGRTGEALDAYQETIRLDPQNITYHFKLAETLKSLNRTEEALGAYQKAIKLDPTRADAYHGKGVILFKEETL